MPVSMEQVMAFLDVEEPDYSEGAKLGADALPHLEAILRSGDRAFASKATYLVGRIAHQRSGEVLQQAAQSQDPVIRVAAAKAARHLPAPAASSVLISLVGDRDVGVRKTALRSVPASASPDLRLRLRALVEQEESPTLRELSRKVVGNLET